MHNCCAITIKTPDSALRLCHCDAKSYLRRMPHTAYSQEIAFVTLVHSCTILKEFTANHASCADYDIFLTQCSCHHLDSFLTAHGEVILFYILKFIILEGFLLYDQGKDFLVVKGLHSFGNLFLRLVLFLRKNFIVYPHYIQQASGYFALLYMLRLVMNTRLTTPTNQQQYGNVINVLVC